jgi:hypothetical protein
MKSLSLPIFSIPVVSLFLPLPILAFAGSGWEPWKAVVLCLVLFVAVSALVALSVRPAVVGRGAGTLVACPEKPGPVRPEKQVEESSDLTLREAREEDCTLWDCF